MKTRHKTYFGILLGGAMLAGVSSAQDGNRPPPPGGPEGRGNPIEMLKRADTDGDGKVSKEEFIKARSAELGEVFGRMDANGDGFIDEAEVQAMGERMREAYNRGGEGMRRPDGEGGFRRPPEGEGRPEGMRRPDGEGGFRRPPEGEGRPEGMRRPDGEGGFRRPEGGPPGGDRAGFMGNEMFSRMDVNKDGMLSKDEFEQGMARMREMLRGGMGRGEGPGGFRGPGGPEGMRRPEGGEGGFRRPPQQGGEGAGRARPELEGGDAPKKDEAPKKEDV